MIEINTLVLTYTPAQRARLDEEDSLTKNWAQNVILTKLQKGPQEEFLARSFKTISDSVC